jgi:hypothetical protein
MIGGYNVAIESPIQSLSSPELPRSSYGNNFANSSKISCKLTAVPDQLTQMKSLESIYLDGNALEDFPCIDRCIRMR